MARSASTSLKDADDRETVGLENRGGLSHLLGRPAHDDDGRYGRSALVAAVCCGR
jgi:hypothetical protein